MFLARLFFISLVFCGTVWGQRQIVVQPASIDDILYNPGIGVEVFHQGTQPTPFPPSRIFYWRFNWTDIETERGQIDFARIDRELATARAAGKAGTVYVLSTASSFSIEEVATVASGPLWFQLYLGRDREISARSCSGLRRRGIRPCVYLSICR